MKKFLLRLFKALLAARPRRRRPAEATPHDSGPLDRQFTEAMAVLKDSARQSGRRGLIEGGRYLYEKPWYLFLGMPGSGKTSALLGAGLAFPLAARMGRSAARGALPTQDCDWWPTEEAVLLDTAGRYARQSHGETGDVRDWMRLLELLKKTRPRRPLNGVLLTVAVPELLRQGAAARKEQAASLRLRLQELHQRLGVRPPVYLLVTKTDLVAGFEESFRALSSRERTQVWGFSYAWGAGGKDTPAEGFAREFAALQERLRAGLLERLQAERDPLRRAAILAFLPQFAGLKDLLGGFLEAVFEGGGDLEERALLRGVYFCSAARQGKPVDRVLGALSRAFAVDGPETAKPAVPRGGGGFFLGRLLREVVFPEQALVGESRRTETLRRRGRRLAIACMVLASLALLAGWTVSFIRNRAYLDEVAARLPELLEAVEAIPPSGGTDASDLPHPLDQTLAVARPAGFDIARPPLLNTLGLYQGAHLRAGAELGYRRLLDRALLPRVSMRLEEQLRSVNHDNLEAAYEALKAYLMLHTPGHADKQALKNWILLDWDANQAGALTPEDRAALARHLDAALSARNPLALSPMDRTLVDSVREMLGAYAPEFRVYSRIKRVGIGGDCPDFSVVSEGGPAAAQVFERASGNPLSKGVPCLFTRGGYLDAFRGAVARMVGQLREEERWVLGEAAQGPSPRSGDAEIGGRVEQLYLREYIQVWDAYLEDVRLVGLDSLARSLSVARLLQAPDSPLAAFLRGASRETRLAPATPAAGPSELEELAHKARQEMRELATLMGSVPAAEAPPAAPPAQAMVDEHFAWLHRLTAGQPAPLDESMKLFGELYMELSALDAAQKSRSPPAPGVGTAGILMAAEVQPEPIKSMLQALGDAGSRQSRSAARLGLAAELRPITEFCAHTISGRYPFAQGSRSDAMPDDFGQVFGVGGLLDEFFRRRLADLVDTGASPWAYKPLADGSLPPGSAALAEFERAAFIRQAFFRAGGKVPGFQIDLRLLDMAEGLKEVTLEVDGQTLRLGAGGETALTIAWPPARVDSRIRLSAPGTEVHVFDGPWALFRLIDHFEIQHSARPERFTLLLNLSGKRARLELTSRSAINPLRLRELHSFRCPDAL